jgi:hypothetical protein
LSVGARGEGALHWLHMYEMVDDQDEDAWKAVATFTVGKSDFKLKGFRPLVCSDQQCFVSVPSVVRLPFCAPMIPKFAGTVFVIQKVAAPPILTDAEADSNDARSGVR